MHSIKQRSYERRSIEMSEFSTGYDETVVGLRYRHRLDAGAQAPLAVLVHGRAGTRDVMWLFRRCLPESCNIISFEAPDPDPIGGFSWWEVTEGPLDPEPILHAWSLFEAGLSRALHHHGLTPSKQIALGFSQGGGLLSVGMIERQELFSGVAILAGFAAKRAIESLSPGVKNLNRESLARLFWAHGTKDEVVSISRAKRDYAYLQSLGFIGEMIEDPVGHKVGSAGMRSLKQWAEELLS
jgi:phospholipase/carboxylesterase